MRFADDARPKFQCSSASRKFLNSRSSDAKAVGASVSVLFSEPKIPQCVRQIHGTTPALVFQCSSASRKFLNSVASTLGATRQTRFSALQRAENSSMFVYRNNQPTHTQRFSALQRAENSSIEHKEHTILEIRAGFSALQRAENSSIHVRRRAPEFYYPFQCSSASRKFLNPACKVVVLVLPLRFSALQRAENSSICTSTLSHSPPSEFQCSSASRKFLNALRRLALHSEEGVSVLFSEPKIPQLRCALMSTPSRLSFSALQRAENSSIQTTRLVPFQSTKFQCSSASRKFLN